LALKTFPENGELIFKMVLVSKSMDPPMKNVTDQLVTMLMDMDSPKSVQYKAEYARRFTPGGISAGINLYKNAIEKLENDVELSYQMAKFIEAHEPSKEHIPEILTR
jgi:hypothetical protein